MYYSSYCSSSNEGQVRFRVRGQEADLEGPDVIKMLKLKVFVMVNVIQCSGGIGTVLTADKWLV